MNAAVIFLIIALIAGVIAAIYLFNKRSAEQRKAHDARLRAMAQTYLSAAKKKQAAEAKAAAAAAVAAPERKERECPFCAELILEKAKVCKHCGRDVAPLA